MDGAARRIGNAEGICTEPRLIYITAAQNLFAICKITNAK
jgi:hypothetical protein